MDLGLEINYFTDRSITNLALVKASVLGLVKAVFILCICWKRTTLMEAVVLIIHEIGVFLLPVDKAPRITKLTVRYLKIS